MVGPEPSQQSPETKPPPSTPSGSGEWTAFQNPEATCRNLACTPKQYRTLGALPWLSLCWALGGGPLAQFTTLEPGPLSTVRTAMSPSRLVLCVLSHGGSCPRQLKESLASPGRSPGTHLKAGKHSHWKGRGEEWAQPGVGKTLAVPIPNTLTSYEILLRMGYMDQGCPQ